MLDGGRDKRGVGGGRGCSSDYRGVRQRLLARKVRQDLGCGLLCCLLGEKVCVGERLGGREFVRRERKCCGGGVDGSWRVRGGDSRRRLSRPGVRGCIGQWRQLATMGQEAVDQRRFKAVGREAVIFAQLYQLGFQERVEVRGPEIDGSGHGYGRGGARARRS